MKKKQQNPSKKRVEKKENPGTLKNYGFLLAILVVTFIAYLPALDNGFLWDDDDYIKNNLLIRTIDLKEIFSTFLMGNYHPLTVLGYAIQYKFFGTSAVGYHAVNILLHLVNVVLVYFVVFRLSEKTIVSLVAALLFAVHPMHVESVAWASELKDLLYTMFFLASYIYYMKFMQEGKSKYFAFSLLLFLFSLMSKAMAASLPLLLILTDYFKGYKINAKSLIQKAPYFILSLIFGFVAIHAQQSSGAVDTASFAFPQRIVFASYGFIMYLVKLVFPWELCAYYAYPIPSGGTVPGVYYIFLLLVGGVVAGVIYSLRKTKKLFFSIGFFTVTVLMVLQLLPVGWAIMADRYSYIPSIGIFYLAGEGFLWLWNRKTSGSTYRFIALALLTVSTVFYSVKTSARCLIWKDGFTLWNDVIKQYQTIPQAYINRGIIYMNENKTDSAMSDFNKAISLEPEFSKGYSNRAILYTNANIFDKALADYNKSLSLDPTNPIAYHNRGILYKKNNMLPQAYENFSEAIRRKPTYIDAYHNRGSTLYSLQRYEEALTDLNRALQLQPNTPKTLFFRGMVEYQMGRKEVACQDLQRAMNFGHKQAAEQYGVLCK